jgi:transcriptional regulator with XRE-family HTH domain
MSPGRGVSEGIIMAKSKGSNRIDAHVGSRLRLRRVERGMTQEKLAVAFGLTFQQVQKYEKGMNRMGSSRLLKRDLSKARTPLSHLYGRMVNTIGWLVRQPVWFSKGWH